MLNLRRLLDDMRKWIYSAAAAKGFIEQIIFGVEPRYSCPRMTCNPHQMVVDHIGKIICRETIRLQHNSIVQLIVVDRTLSVDMVKSCRPGFRMRWKITARSLRSFFLDLCRAQIPTWVAKALRSPVLSSAGLSFLTKTIIGIAPLDQLRVFHMIGSRWL